MTSLRSANLWLSVLSVAGIGLVAGCLPFAHVPDTAAVERYYARGVQPAQLELLASGVGRGQRGLQECTSLAWVRPGTGGGWDDTHWDAITPAELEGWNAVFLHISDAHIRDEAIMTPVYEQQLRTSVEMLKFLGQPEAAQAALRPRLVTRWSALRLAGFTTAAAKLGIPDVVHTGDLTDLSLLPELQQGLVALRPPPDSNLRVQCAAGNHDGFFFGNLRLDYTDPSEDKDGVITYYLKRLDAVSHRQFLKLEPQTHHLGVTKTEFVLANLWAVKDGYGFGRAPIARENDHPRTLALTGIDDPDAERKLRDYVRAKRIHAITEFWQAHEPPPSDPYLLVPFPVSLHEWRHQIGVDLRGEIGRDLPAEDRLSIRKWCEQNGCKDTRELIRARSEPHLACYYSFAMSSTVGSSAAKVKAIVLDTRACHYEKGDFFSGGDIDDAQLKWLYGQLSEAKQQSEPVVLFAHHPPGNTHFMRKSPNRKKFENLLKSFRSIIIAYFCGHTHANNANSDLGFWVIQTGSTCEFPQVGRLVRIRLNGCEATLSMPFVDIVARPTGGPLADDVANALTECRQATWDLPEPTSRTRLEREVLRQRAERMEAWGTESRKPQEEKVILDFSFAGLTYEDAVKKSRSR